MENPESSKIKSQPEVTGEDTQESLDKRLKVVEKNHKLAISAYELENYLSKGLPTDLKQDDKLLGILEELPSQLRSNFETAIQHYSHDVKEMQKKRWEMEEIITRHQEAGLSIEPEEILGELAFVDLSHPYPARPQGRVTLSSQEGYFVLKFDKEEDYDAIRNRLSGGWNNRLKSSGCFYNMLSLTISKSHYRGPVIFVTRRRPLKEVLTHERQHYINHNVLKKFSLTEELNSEVAHEAEGSVYRSIKDEILSFIRDGSSGTGLRESIYCSLYKHLFDALPEEERKKAEKVIDELVSFLNNNSSLLSSPEARAILSYQLACVSFPKFPNWLKAFKDYYQDKINLLGDFDIETRMVVDWFPSAAKYDFLAENLYASRYESYLGERREELKKINEQMEEVREKSRQIAFNQPLTTAKEELAALKEEYLKLLQRFKEIFSFIQKEGIVPPHHSPMRTYEYGEEDSDARDNETEYTKIFQEKVMGFLTDYPQTDMDLIASFFERDESEEGDKARKKFIKKLKELIHQINDHQACWIGMDRDESYPHSFYVSINSLAQSEDKKKGIKGIVLDVTVHGSGFKI